MKKEFIKFLKSKRLWSKFQKEWNDMGEDETVNDYLEYLNDFSEEDYIRLMDYEVSKFWITIDIQWQKHLDAKS